MATVSVRYIVDDVDAAIAFYTRHLGFDEVMHPAPTFAMLARGDLRLVLSAPSGGRAAAGRRCPTVRGPSPAAGTASRSRSPTSPPWSTTLRTAGVRFRNDIVTGVGGKQILLDDPSGNPVELFEPTRSEAFLAPS